MNKDVVQDGTHLEQIRAQRLQVSSGVYITMQTEHGYSTYKYNRCKE